jgi:leader peptidase (prepilin peptidase)/N-methyltransferase
VNLLAESDMTTLAAIPLWMLQHLPACVFVFCFGACVGSFLNVVIYRLPAGMSVISPPSRCPTCGARLKFIRENIPIIGWFMIRGKCRYCGVRVSAQYMIVELMMALVFLAAYALLFMVGPQTPWWGDIGGPWWAMNGFFRVWPAFFLFTLLIAALFGMTMIDAKTYTIPIEIPNFIALAAFILWPLQTLLPNRMTQQMTWAIPGVNWSWCLAAFGGVIGVLIGVALLKTGRLKYSFADYYDYVKEEDIIGDYPHARREMGRESLFLLPCILGCVGGYLLGRLPGGAPPEFLQALGASMLGYISGGGIVWATRIFGSLAFGKEAMGQGDVHLLAAVGAVLGWFDPVLIFFIAPFSGLLWAFLSMGLGRFIKIFGRHIPYGPHLAIATLVVILCRPGLASLWNAYFLSTMPMPVAGFIATP